MPPTWETTGEKRSTFEIMIVVRWPSTLMHNHIPLSLYDPIMKTISMWTVTECLRVFGRILTLNEMTIVKVIAYM